MNLKGKDEEMEELHISKKKSSKELEALQTSMDELRASNSKLEKSKKRLQEEVNNIVL
jgi:prefoldin subunit 5